MAHEPQSDRIDISHEDIGAAVVLTLSGELSLRTVPQTRSAVQKHLADRGRVLVDLSGLAVSWAPAMEVFALALASAGGWPAARLVLFGTPLPHPASRHPTRYVSGAVHVVPTLDEAVAMLAERPRRLSRRMELTCQPEAARWARTIARSACEDWGIATTRRGADATATVESTVSELVANAVVHARTSMTVSLTLSHRGLYIAVRDYARGGSIELDDDPDSDDARLGLVVVAGVSRSWGVSRHDDGKTVWAFVPCVFAPGHGDH